MNSITPRGEHQNNGHTCPVLFKNSLHRMAAPRASHANKPPLRVRIVHVITTDAKVFISPHSTTEISMVPILLSRKIGSASRILCRLFSGRELNGREREHKLKKGECQGMVVCVTGYKVRVSEPIDALFARTFGRGFLRMAFFPHRRPFDVNLVPINSAHVLAFRLFRSRRRADGSARFKRPIEIPRRPSCP